MKKGTTISLVKLRKIQDSFCDKRPNVYAFLIDRGVDPKTAEDAQEMVTAHYVTGSAWLTRAFKPMARELAHQIERTIKKIERLADGLPRIADPDQ